MRLRGLIKFDQYVRTQKNVQEGQDNLTHTKAIKVFFIAFY